MAESNSLSFIRQEWHFHPCQAAAQTTTQFSSVPEPSSVLVSLTELGVAFSSVLSQPAIQFSSVPEPSTVGSARSGIFIRPEPASHSVFIRARAFNRAGESDSARSGIFIRPEPASQPFTQFSSVPEPSTVLLSLTQSGVAFSSVLSQPATQFSSVPESSSVLVNPTQQPSIPCITGKK